MTSICSTLRLNGVLIIQIITRLSVIMRIIGRILEGNPTFLITIQWNYVRTGKQGLLSVNMRKAAYFKHLVRNAMVGKSRSIIHIIIKLNHVRIRSAMVVINAPSIIVIKRGELWKKVKN